MQDVRESGCPGCWADWSKEVSGSAVRSVVRARSTDQGVNVGGTTGTLSVVEREMRVQVRGWESNRVASVSVVANA